MIIRTRELDEFEKEQIRKERPDLERNLKIVESLYELAIELGALPPKDPLEGIELKIWMAKVINSV
jgi:hypothetical protein